MNDKNDRPIKFELEEDSRLAIEQLALEEEIESLDEEECEKIAAGGISFTACNMPFQ